MNDSSEQRMTRSPDQQPPTEPALPAPDAGSASSALAGVVSRLSVPVTLHRWLLPAAAMALVLGGVLLWLGWRESSADRLDHAIVEQRDRLADVLRSDVDALRVQFDATASASDVVAALQAADYTGAAAVVKRLWPELSAVECHAPDLSTELNTEGRRPSFGRLALMHQALLGTDVVVRVVKGQSAPMLALARRVDADGRVLGVAIAEVPIDTLAAHLIELVPAGGFLGIKQGRTLIAQHGDAALAQIAELKSVTMTDLPWRLVAAAPAPATLPVSGAPAMLIGAILLLVAGLAVVLARQPPRAEAESVEATFAETLRSSSPSATTSAARPKASNVDIERSIFRAYDVRGIVGKNLDERVARFLGQAIGSLMHDQGLRQIVVGRDGRHSGPALAAALIEGLRATGRDVIDIGQAATPMVYFAGFHLRTGCGVSVTGSHNPPDYNGFKIVVGGETLHGEAIQDLYARIAEDRLHSADRPGDLRLETVADAYVQRIADDVQVERRLKVVVDCGNGVAGATAPAVLEAIGCEVVSLYCEVDGDFPNHHPDPSEPENLTDLIGMTQRLGADVGIALDGDGDRLGVVTPSGKIIYPDRVLMLFAQDVLARNPGACVIYDVKCTGQLAAHILRHGGSPVMWKTGHSLMKAKMRETEAELAGEMSGHFFFRERWYGFDDGVYAAARLLEILATSPETADEVFAALPEGVATPELKVDVVEGQGPSLIQRILAQGGFEGARISTIDGVRADWPDGWGLVRASNTTPVLVLRFEANDGVALARIQNLFRERLLAVAPSMTLPF